MMMMMMMMMMMLMLMAIGDADDDNDIAQKEDKFSLSFSAKDFVEAAQQQMCPVFTAICCL